MCFRYMKDGVNTLLNNRHSKLNTTYSNYENKELVVLSCDFTELLSDFKILKEINSLKKECHCIKVNRQTWWVTIVKEDKYL